MHGALSDFATAIASRTARPDRLLTLSHILTAWSGRAFLSTTSGGSSAPVPGASVSEPAPWCPSRIPALPTSLPLPSGRQHISVTSARADSHTEAFRFRNTYASSSSSSSSSFASARCSWDRLPHSAASAPTALTRSPVPAGDQQQHPSPSWWTLFPSRQQRPRKAPTSHASSLPLPLAQHPAAPCPSTTAVHRRNPASPAALPGRHFTAAAASSPSAASSSPASQPFTRGAAFASSASPASATTSGSASSSSSASASSSSSGPAKGASVDPREAAKFAALAASWWSTGEGPFAPLHALNPVRVRFVRQSLAAALGLDGGAPEPLAGLRVLDVGCGGGILSESLARLGADVHGIDVTRENVEAARLHARSDPRVAARVRYDVISAEDLAASGTAKYDVVFASEVLEHVIKPHQLLGVLASLMAGGPGGEGPGTVRLANEEGERAEHGAGFEGGDGSPSPAASALVVSTINRTPAAWALAIAAAEYITRVVPPGTHQWHKFITPEEMAVMADACGLRVWHASGMAPTGPRMSWQLTGDLSVNYIATLVRRQ